MYRSYADTGGNVNEEIKLLNSISRVSADWQGTSHSLPQANTRKEEKHMSGMSDMAMTIEELRSAAAAINDTANWLAQQFSGNADETVEQLKEPELKLEDVRAVLADMSRKGHTAEIRALLQKYGAVKLSGVDPANYKALLKDVEGLDHA